MIIIHVFPGCCIVHLDGLDVHEAIMSDDSRLITFQEESRLGSWD